MMCVYLGCNGETNAKDLREIKTVRWIQHFCFAWLQQHHGIGWYPTVCLAVWLSGCLKQPVDSSVMSVHDTWTESCPSAMHHGFQDILLY